MLAQTILFIVVLLLMSGLFHVVPGLTRPDIFFAVTVPPEFRQRVLDEARAILSMA